MSSIPENTPKKPRPKHVGQISRIKVKWCSKCSKDLPVSDFYKNKATTSGYTSYCRKCMGLLQKKYQASQTEPRTNHRPYLLKNKYNMTVDEYNALLQSQNHCCAICGSPNHGGRNWNVDHDHVTGAVRGILCQGCNMSLGGARDNPATLRAAADYLEKHGK